MEIINEIICKHTYHGKELPSNIYFICTCERYIPPKERLFEIAKNMELNENELEKIKKIKYEEVYPLPLSLLNFVVDFGNLSIRDKVSIIRYIKKIKFDN